MARKNMTSSIMVLHGDNELEYSRMFPMPSAITKVRHVGNFTNEHSPCMLYQDFYLEHAADVLIYMHDDLEIYGKWHDRVMAEFKDDSVVCVGFGGAVKLGHPDLYKRGYALNNMARSGYVSNQRDWQTHGGHLVSSKRVAVLDAFFMAVRRSLLVKAGGWPIYNADLNTGLTHHCLDLWLACEAARQGKKTLVLDVDCIHYGGGTSTKQAYADAPWLQGGTRDMDHTKPHRWLYQEYRDVLPIDVTKL